MSKRSIILAVVAILLFIAAIISVSMDKKEAEDLPDPDIEDQTEEERKAAWAKRMLDAKAAKAAKAAAEKEAADNGTDKKD